MNIINKGLLNIALLPVPFYKKIGVDVNKLKAIVSTKLIMDDRRPNSLQQVKSKEKRVSMATIGTMVISALLGLVYLLVFSVGNDIITQLTFYFTLFFFMLSLTLISDFTSVLIDIRDNYIILPKPVNDRTFVIARLLHIFIHLCKIVLPMSIAGLVYMGRQYSLYGAFLFLLVIVFVTGVSIFFINALYIVILRLTTPQRFQSIISYVQIFFSIVMYGSYQLFPRMIQGLNVSEFNIASQKAIIVYPIYWLSYSWQVLYTFEGSGKEILLALAGIIFPLLCIIIVIRYLAPSFNKKLALLSSSTTAPVTKATTVSTQKKSYADRLSNWVATTTTEKAGFLFTWKMTSRSRDFKVKVYPAIGYVVVYAVILLLNKNLSLAHLQEDEGTEKMMVLGGIYFTSFLLLIAIGQIVYSEKFKAAWMYYTTPLKNPGEILSGATKAAILKFYVPIVVIMTLVGLVLLGPKILPNIMLGLFNEILISFLLVYIGQKYFPFSVQQSTSAKTGSFLRGLSIVVLSGFIGMLHYFVYSIFAAVAICIVLSAIASWLLMGSIKKTGWQKIKSSYAGE